jgi:subtilisin family serine protease
MTKATQRLVSGAAFCALALGATLEVKAQHCAEGIYQCGVQIDDESFYRQWGLKAINVCGAWSMGYMGDSIVVGIVDAGILEYHPDLLGQVQPVIGGCSEERPNFAECIRCVSEDTHGTEVASIVAALANNPDNELGWNMVGVAPHATLAEVYIYDDGGGDPGSIEEHIQVIEFNNDCIDVKVHAYDLAGESGGKYVPIPGSIRTALDAAVSSGRGGLGQVFVWTSGNGGAQSERADYEELVSSRHSIVVGAIDEDLTRLDISETGSCLACVAPANT